jgi:hypothetical protein
MAMQSRAANSIRRERLRAIGSSSLVYRRDEVIVILVPLTCTGSEET